MMTVGQSKCNILMRPQFKIVEGMDYKYRTKKPKIPRRTKIPRGAKEKNKEGMEKGGKNLRRR
jgi:hypothetical protein